MRRAQREASACSAGPRRTLAACRRAGPLNRKPPMIEFFFDCSSPWTYLAFHNIQPMAAELGVRSRWRPILVGGVFNTVNPSVYASRETPVPAQGALHAQGPCGLGALGGPDDQDAADGVSGEQRQGDARLHLAGAEGQLVPFATRGVRGLLGRRRGHLAGRGADRDLPAARHRPAAFFAGIAEQAVKDAAQGQHRRGDARAAASARRPSSSTATTCISATTACR